MQRLEELRSKYEEMRALRSAAAGQADPRPRLAALAARFPGALREIDDLPLPEIDRRIEALSRAAADPAHVAPWMHAMSRFHTLARGALVAKRSLTDATIAWPDDAQLWREHLGRVAAPPRGRLMDLVYEQLAAEMGTTPATAKELVFGPSRRARLRAL